MHALVAAGADVIELGVPFSDPMADGPVIQRASERALAQRRRPDATCSAIVRAFRAQRRDDADRADGLRQPDRGDGRRRRFADRARDAGVDGVLVVDYPPEEAADFAALLQARGIDPIFLLAPTTPDARIAAVARRRARLRLLRVAEGRDRRRPPRHRRRRAQARRRSAAHVKLPVGVGFGIRDAATRAGGRRASPTPSSSAAASSRRSKPARRGDAAARAGAWLAGIRSALDAMRERAGAAPEDAHRERDRTMSWLAKLLPPRIKSTTGANASTPVPEGLWIKCPSCEAVLYRTDLEKNLFVCPKCSHHSRVGARERIEQLLDPEGRFEIVTAVFGAM